MCSITQAVESAREHFSVENRLDVPHYYLTPVYTEAPYILSDAGLQAEDGSAMVIGVAMVGIDLKDNTVNLATSEGPTSTLMIRRLLHLKTNLVLVPPQLSHPAWTRMRRAGIWFESFIHFTALYAPPNRSELEINAHQLGLMRDLHVPRASGIVDFGRPAGQSKGSTTQAQGGYPGVPRGEMVIKMKLQRKSSQ